MDEDQVVGYYCAKCRKSVECRITVYGKVVSLIPPHQVKVGVEARCPHCGMEIASGDGVVELC